MPTSKLEQACHLEAVRFLSTVKGIPDTVGYVLYNHDPIFRRSVDHLAQIYHLVRSHPSIKEEYKEMEYKNHQLYDLEANVSEMKMERLAKEDEEG